MIRLSKVMTLVEDVHSHRFDVFFPVQLWYIASCAASEVRSKLFTSKLKASQYPLCLKH